MKITNELYIALRISKAYSDLNQKARVAENSVSDVLIGLPTDLVSIEEKELLTAAALLLDKIRTRTSEYEAKEAILKYEIGK